jgi:hypothetical protein
MIDSCTTGNVLFNVTGYMLRFSTVRLEEKRHDMIDSCTTGNALFNVTGYMYYYTDNDIACSQS